MTLHIYADRKLVCSLESDSLKNMLPIFRQFQDCTGIRISEYDDTGLAPNHAGLLIKLMDEFYIRSKIPFEVSKLRQELSNSYDCGNYLDLVGE